MAHDHHDHDHDHHDNGHGHHPHAPANFDRAFAIGVTLNLGFVLIEGAFGFFSDSLALLADAGHNLSDVAGLLLAWAAAWLARKGPSPRRTYGYGRASILAALANAMLLMAAIGAIGWEAVHRLMNPEPVATSTMIWVAAVGIAINTATAMLFMRGGKDDLNIRGAFLHMAADAAVSAGVVVAGLLIAVTSWLWLDPVMSLVIAAVIALSSWDLLKNSMALAVDTIPAGIDREKVEAYLLSLENVSEVHDLHIWPLSTTQTALTAHVVRSGANIDDHFTREVAEYLHEMFGIGHVTIQIESAGHACALAPDHIV